MSEFVPPGFERTVAVLRAVGEPTRLRIVALLTQGELTVSEFVSILGQSQPRVSRHLKMLAEAGVVERLPEGAWAFYRLAEPGDPVRAIVEAALASLPLEDRALKRDRDQLALVAADRNEAAAAYFAAVAPDWDRIRALHLDEDMVEAAVRAAAGLGPFDVMIDVGAGSGRMLHVLADRVRRGVGIDLSHEMLTIARANLRGAGLAHCSVRHGDLYALPFNDQTADLVTIHQVLHYLDAPARAISEAARVLAPGGRLIVVDFAPHALEFLRTDHAHRRLGFADADISEWSAAAGLQVEPPDTLAANAVGDGQALTVKVWRAAAPVVTSGGREAAPQTASHTAPVTINGDAA